MKKLITLLICFSSMLGIANAATYYVDLTGGGSPTGDGSSWANAFQTWTAFRTAGAATSVLTFSRSGAQNNFSGATFSSASTTITLSAANSNLLVGDNVSGTGIASGTKISTISGTTITLDKNTTAASSTGFLSDATVDNIYIKGSIPSQTTTWTGCMDNFYGSFAGTESDPSQRPMNDNDGNGIVESWEFQYPTTYTCTGTNVIAITGSATVLDGFTITHVPSVPFSGGASCATLVSPLGQTVQNCVLTGSNLTYGTSYTNGGNGGCLLRVLGTFKNNLIEKNVVSITASSDVRNYPILDVPLTNTGSSTVSVSGCVFRNNKASITNYGTATSYSRGYIINVSSTSGTNAVSFSDCLVYNNEAIYNGPSTSVNAIVCTTTYTGSSTPESYINCLFANNKTTNLTTCFYAASGTIVRKVYNCAFWNNLNTVSATGITSGVSMASSGGQNASSVFSNNYLDVVTSGNFGTAWTNYTNKTDLSKSNTAVKAPKFKNPSLNSGSNVIGAFQDASDPNCIAISQADWRLNSGSYLAANGSATGTGLILPISNKDKAGNSFASSPAVGPYEVSASAATITGITAGNTSLSVAFTAPAYDGGSAITNYKYSTDGGANWTLANTTSSPIGITGLTNGTSYNVQIKAVNANGDGMATASSVGAPVASSTTPSVPTINSITSASAQLTINYTPGSDGGSAITGYKYSTDGGVNFVDIATANPLVITTQSTSGTPSLFNGTSYSVQIKAVNANGSGVATVSTTATPSGQAAAPSSVVITPSTTSLSVAFTAGSNGGSTITNYKYSIDGGTTFTLCNPAQTTSPIVISNLNFATANSVQILAVNAYGDGIATATTAATTTSTTPSAPIITAITPSSGSLSVAFTAPVANGSTITTYKYSTDGGVTFRTRASGTTASPIVISTLSTDGTTALTNGTAYNVQIKAVNANGDGTASPTSICVPVAAATTPAAPTITAINVGSATLAVIFTPGSIGSSAITGYKYSTDGGATWSASASSLAPITKLSSNSATSLTNGTTYPVQIRAVNVTGDGTPSAIFYATPQNSQVITFAAPSKTYGDADFAPATCTSNLTVTYASSNTAVATIVSGQIHIVGVGTSTITASQAGNAAYFAATDVIQILTVNAKPLSITAPTIASKVYDGSTTSGTVTPGTLSGLVSPQTLNVSAVGTYSDANVETGKPATIVYTLANGTGLAANYSLANGSATGDITTSVIAINDGATNYSDVVISGTLTELTVSGNGTVLNVNNTSEVKSLTATTGAQVLVNQPLTVSSEVVLSPNSTLSVANSVNVTGNVEVQSGAKVDVTANQLVVNDLTLNAGYSGNLYDGFSTSSVKVGGDGIKVNGRLKYVRTFDDTQWYFVSFPYDVTISEITSTTAPFDLGTNWFIKYYDGAQRATGVTSNWKHITEAPLLADQTILHAKRGYIIGIASGTPTLTFPMISNTTIAAEVDKTIDVTYYGSGTGVAEVHKGWNLIGQPFLSKYNAGGVGTTNIPYMIFSDGGSVRTYTSKLPNDVTNLNPFVSFFVQVDATIASNKASFATSGRQLARSLVEPELSDRVKIYFNTATGSDNTNLLMDNSQTTAYQIGQDLEKWIGTGTPKPQIYTSLGGVNYDYNGLPMTSVVNLPLGIYTQTAGSTTIHADAALAPSLSKLLLIDNSTNPATVTDLLMSDYTFTAAAGTNNSRFAITAQRVATDNNQIDKNVDAPKLSIINYQLSIENLVGKASVRVFDALGRMVANKTTSDNSLEINLSAKGMYTVQIEAGGKSWIKKIVN